MKIHKLTLKDTIKESINYFGFISTDSNRLRNMVWDLAIHCDDYNLGTLEEAEDANNTELFAREEARYNKVYAEVVRELTEHYKTLGI